MYDPGIRWNDVPGVYIFAGPAGQPNRWTAFYIGQCASFKDRLPNHERWDEAERLGATHIHARRVQSQASRDELEASLIDGCDPPLNRQHRR